MKIIIVGGTFDDHGGKPSGLINKINLSFQNLGIRTTLKNGGHFNNLETIMNNISDENVVLWMANVPNDKEKFRDVKSLYPKKYLIMSKRNNGEYSFSQMINRALTQKANLMLEFQSGDNGFSMRVFDPLGSVWCDYTNNIDKVTVAIKERLDFIMNITRVPSHISDSVAPEVPDVPEFYALVKDYAEVFHALVNPDNSVTRFLGNSSFRCQRGFPSFRQDDLIFVSRRNIDKRFIAKEGFVPTTLKDGEIYYWGEHKPSVDTPIQVRLYEALPNINFMLHSHVYLEDAPFTTHAVPCGALEEVEEVLNLIADKNVNYFEINLIGHGCIVFANTVEQIKNLKYISRPMPEVL
jgi:ribulose-5-phosphate 4-epimerase/fuculose-1-phosphate aldolase